jgi:MIP family channel proteins
LIETLPHVLIHPKHDSVVESTPKYWWSYNHQRTQLIMNALTKPLLAEFIGTFALIFVGAGAGAVLGGNQVMAVAFAHGLTIMIFATAFGDISGCHINPAVTVGLATAGVFPTRRVLPYLAAQFAGAIAAGYCLLLVLGGPVNHLGATMIDTNRIRDEGAFVLEAIGTFFLVNTVLHVAVRKSAERLAPMAIGMTVTICILMFGNLTGGSVNPARTVGPAVAAGIYDGVAVYLTAQLVGCILAGLLYRTVWAPEPLPNTVSVHRGLVAH